MCLGERFAARVRDPDPRNQDCLAADLHSFSRHRREPVADKPSDGHDLESVRQHGFQGASGKPSIGEHLKRAVLYDAGALCHQIVDVYREASSDAYTPLSTGIGAEPGHIEQRSPITNGPTVASG